MKILFQRALPISLVTLLTTFVMPLTHAGPLKEANVTQIVKEVNLLPEQAAARPAAVNDKVTEKTAVRTGVESRSELTFPDRTLTRLGPQTIFSFREGNRTFNVGGDGSILLNVPKNSGGGKVNSAAVTAAITGTTVLLETHHFPKDTGYHPDSDYTKTNAWFKFLVLEGEARFCRRNHTSDCVVVHEGEMLVGRADSPLGRPVPFDINQFMLNYVLTAEFPSPLPADVLALIAAAANQQQGPLANALIASIDTSPFGVTVGNVQTISNTLGTINPSNMEMGTINPANLGGQVNTPEQSGPP